MASCGLQAAAVVALGLISPVHGEKMEKWA